MIADSRHMPCSLLYCGIDRLVVKNFFFFFFYIDILKGQCHEIFEFRFFRESVSPKPLSIPWMAAQGASLVSLTTVQMGKSSIRKV